ncbi:Rrf2 family transcriptional regulator [Synechococcus sp. BSA11S]|uniref:RrF2 family transcriptional regulator n=1 Tax=Synechococcus sp. BSA11S TaxID=2599077 RepID=UPI00162A4716|nr:Rrf2 family transcriptional regulator [Synechococcus sp. BSA11S]
MTFSTKTAYGLVALIELADVHADGGVLQTGEIARRQGIPERYLEQMLSSLRRRGLLRSIRGPRGGFQLTRPPETITVAEVFTCLEGAAAAQPEHQHCTGAFQVLTALAQKVEQARTRVLAATTLQQLLEQRNAMARPPLMYHI